MTYEEYINEIEDFDDVTKQELLADFQNHLPLNNAAMMQQMGYGGFQNFLKTKNDTGVMQLGESFRGMNNVSPLVAMKLTNQTSKDIATKYFLYGDPPEEGTFTYVSDIRSDLTQYIKDIGDFYYYGKQEKDLFAFKVILFSSTEATKLKECFEVCKPKGREVLIFVEDNSTDSVSGTYGAVRISQDVLDYLNPKNRLAYDLHDNEGVYEYIQRYVPELTDEQIRSLFHNGYIEDTGVELVKGFFKMASFLSSAISTIFPSLAIFTNPAARAATSFLLEKAIEEIETARLGENRWQPKAPKKEDGSVDTSYQYQPLISLGQNENGIVNITQAVKTLKDMLAVQRAMVQNTFQIRNGFKPSTEPSSILEYLYSKYLKAYYVAWNVLGSIEELSELEILKQGVKIYNALLCGVWNGLVDAVSGLFAMVKMIYDGITLGQDFVQNIDKYLPTLLEQFDEALQAIENISFSDTAKYIYGKLEQINLTFDPIACAYFVGYAYGFIISLIIEIVVGILISGGVLDVAVIIQKLQEVIFGIFRLGWGMAKGAAKAVRTFAKFVVKSVEDLIKGFQELLNFLKKGWQELKRIIDDVFEKSVKVLDEQASVFIKKLPSNIGKFVDLLTKNFPKLQKKIVDGLLVLEFKGNVLARINPKGIIVEIKYFRELNNYTYFTELKKVKIELEVVDDLGRKTLKRYEDTVEVMKKGDDVGFRAKFEEGKIRDGEYINYTFEKSNGNPPYATNPKSKSKVIDKFLKNGDEFYIVENFKQDAPGSFLTNKPVFTIKDLREKLAVLESWKNSSDPLKGKLVIRKYKVLKEFPVRDGYIGPMLETTKGSTNYGKVYKGGNQQYESLKRFVKDDIYIPSEGGSSSGKIIEQVESFEKFLK